MYVCICIPAVQCGTLCHTVSVTMCHFTLTVLLGIINGNLFETPILLVCTSETCLSHRSGS